MRRLAMFAIVLGVVLFVSEETAFAQRGHGRGPRIRDTSRMRGGRGHSLDRRERYNSAASRRRESVRTSDLNGRKSVGDHLTRNSKLSDRLKGLLGVNDSKLYAYAQDFKNLGQFVAAVHVSYNLGLDFEVLKMKMTEGEPPMSLGKAIKDMEPEVNATRELRKANKQAEEDLDQTSQ